MKRFLLLLCLCCACLACQLVVAQVNQVWVANYGGVASSFDWTTGMAADHNGNVYVTGWSIGITSGRDLCTIKYDLWGRQEWVAIYTTPLQFGDEYAEDIAVDAQGNVFVTGYSQGDTTDWDGITVKYNSQGQQQWAVRYDDPGNGSNRSHALALCPDGGLCIAGTTDEMGSFDYLVLKYDSTGHEAWHATYDGPGGDIDEAHFIVVDSTGYIYVSGFCDPDASMSTPPIDYCTMKYNPEGQQLWVQLFGGAGDYTDQPSDLAIDSDGSVYVTGYCSSSGSPTYDSDYATVKYSGDGQELWVKLYSGPPDYGDLAAALDVGSDGCIYVTGRSSGSGTSLDYATIKYSPDGHEFWVARYSSYGDSWDVGVDVAVDDSNYVYVTGISNQGLYVGWDDYVTVKYDSAGQLLWEMRYNSPIGEEDEAVALTLDGLGGTIVTGYSDFLVGGWANYNYVTVKYYPGELPNLPPQINSWQPANLDTVAQGQTVLFYIQATDPYGGDTLYYEWRLDGDVVATNWFCQITFGLPGNHQVVGWVSDGELADSVIWDVYVVALGVTDSPGCPLNFAFSAYPNPFNPTTILTFDLPVAGLVKLEVFDTSGRAVGVRHASPLQQGQWYPAGTHQITFDGSGLPSGIYLARISAGDWSAVQKMVLMK